MLAFEVLFNIRLIGGRNISKKKSFFFFEESFFFPFFMQDK